MGGPRESGQSAVLTMLQFNATQSSRTFFDHETVASALDNICALYEKELKLLNPKVPNITYDIADLYGYLDALHNVSLLMYVWKHALPKIVSTILMCVRCLRLRHRYHEPIHGYLPRNKEWIKRQLFTHLKGQASGE